MPTASTRSVARSRSRSRTAKRAAARKRLIAAEDLLKFQFVGDPQISPDGSAIVFVKKHIDPDKNEYITNLWIAGTTGKHNGAMQPRQFTSSGKDSQPRWSPDGSRIAFVSGRSKPKPQIYTIPAGGGEAVALTDFPEGSIGEFRWSPDGSMLAVSFREQDPEWTEQAKKKRREKGLSDPPRVLDDWWYRLDGDGYFNTQRHRLYIVNARTGEHREVYRRDTLGHFSFDFSPDSRELVIATNRDPKAMIRPWKAELLRLNIASGKTKAIPNLPEGPKDHVRWSPDGSLIAYVGRVGRDGAYSVENLELWVCDPKTGETRNLTGKEDYCLLAVAISDAAEAKFAPNFMWSPDATRLYMQIGWHGETHIASINANGRGTLTFHTRGEYAHTMGNIASDGKTIALTRGSAIQLDEVYVGTVNGKGALTLTARSDFNGPLLRELKIAKPQSHWIKSADGNRVHVWSMKPPEYRTTRKYPAVLEIHGGPHAQYGVGFFHEFQVLAAQGYAVFYSNPRGSKGYGRDHTAAIRGSWGGADWRDIQAVIAFMKQQSFVNPKRMGVMGGSYGGYMTNWVIGHTREFAGAITDRCVSNLVSMFGTSDYTDAPDQYWPGNSWNKPEKMWEMSPLKYLGNARTPTLIIHSEGDLRCNVEQAEQVFTVLKLNNVPTRFVRYPSCTSHGMSRSGPPDLRLHRLHQILEWWRKYLQRQK